MSSEMCTAPDCDRQRGYGRRLYCEMHYYRIRRNGTLSARPVRARRETCIIDGCNKLDGGLHGLCDMHATRQRRHGDPSVVLSPPPRVAEANHNWTGDRATYSAAHQRHRKALGPARAHSCVDCGGGAQHWSYNHDDPDERTELAGKYAGRAYSLDASHYRPRCISCHKKYDLGLLNAKA